MSGSIMAPAHAEEATIHAVIHRADGTVVDLGIVSYYHRNPLKRLAWKVKKLFKRRHA